LSDIVGGLIKSVADGHLRRREPTGTGAAADGSDRRRRPPRPERQRKTLAWERPLRRAEDLQALGYAAPKGPILAARVPDLGAKEARLAEDDQVYFTTPHLDGHPAILVRLDWVAMPELKELLVEAWLSRAPKRLATEYLDVPPRRPLLQDPRPPTTPVACRSPCRSRWRAGCSVAST
ncbi:MAG TPA: hypothetical protein VF880_07810, partial [Actinomycetes bacterium]